MKSLLTLSAVAASLFSTTAALADVSITVKSSTGSEGTLYFSEDAVTVDSETALFCKGTSSDVESAKLWMPDMGHGSTPVTLEAYGSCTRINDMQFFMSGKWEVIVKLVDAQSFVFPVNVKGN